MRITTYKLKQIIEEELASQIKIVTDETGAEETETIGPQTKVTTDKSGNISTRSPYDNAPTTVLGDIGVGWDGDKETFKSTQLMTVGSEDELQNMPRKVHGTTSTGKAFTGVKEAPGLGWRTAESLHRSQMYMPQVTGSTLRQLIEEELYKMLLEEKLDLKHLALGPLGAIYRHRDRIKGAMSAAPARGTKWIHDMTQAKPETVEGTVPSHIQPYAKATGGIIPGSTSGMSTTHEYDEETAEARDLSKGAASIAALAALPVAAPALAGHVVSAADVGMTAAEHGAGEGLKAAVINKYLPEGLKFKQIIQQELQNMLFEADCPEGMTAQGNQCVGTAKPQEDPEVFTVAEPNPTEAPTSDASSWEINQAITAKGRAKAEARPPPKPVDRDVGWDSAIDKLGGSLAAMGATKV